MLNIVAGFGSSQIIDSVELLSDKTFPVKTGLYGDGKVAEKIYEIILKEDKTYF